MPRPLPRTLSIRVPEAIYRAVHELADVEERSPSSVARRIIEEPVRRAYRDRFGTDLTRQIGRVAERREDAE